MNNLSELFELVTIPSDTAAEFMRKLDQTCHRWGDKEYWIFRGHNDASWRLEPSLFRNWGSDTHASYEIELVDNFIRNANVRNLEIPSNTIDHIHRLNKSTKRLHTGLAQYDFAHIAFAVAQHSGVDTRLLDFSLDPYIAAWFASDFSRLFSAMEISFEKNPELVWQLARAVVMGNEDDFWNAMREYRAKVLDSLKNTPQNIAVWAIRVHDLEKTSLLLLEHPYTQILNLRAQRGVFVCDTENYESLQRGAKCWKPFDEKLEHLVYTGGIFRLTLPFEQHTELQNLLAQKRVSTHYLKPSLEGVAETVMEITPRSRNFPNR